MRAAVGSDFSSTHYVRHPPTPAQVFARPESLGMENTHRALCPCVYVCVRVFCTQEKSPYEMDQHRQSRRRWCTKKCHSRTHVKKNSDMTHATSQAHMRTHWLDALFQLAKPALSLMAFDTTWALRKAVDSSDRGGPEFKSAARGWINIQTRIYDPWVRLVCK